VLKKTAHAARAVIDLVRKDKILYGIDKGRWRNRSPGPKRRKNRNIGTGQNVRD